jgi:hypothetical protein
MANLDLLVFENGRQKRRPSNAETVDFLAVQIGADALSIAQGGTGLGAYFDFGDKAIRVLSAPTDGFHATNKNYVDTKVDQAIQGLDVKKAVDAATTAPLPANTPSGTGVGKTLTGNDNTPLTIDGIPATNGRRILVKDEVAGQHNGIYIVTQEGDGSTLPFILTRATDMDTDTEAQPMPFCFVSEGSVNADKGFVMTTDANPSSIVIDTTPLTFTQFSSVGSVSAGTGIAVTGQTVSVDADSKSIATSSNYVVAETGKTNFFDMLLSDSSSVAGEVVSFFNVPSAATTIGSTLDFDYTLDNLDAQTATFDAPVAGVTGNVQLTAGVAGVAGNNIVLAVDGIKTLSTLVSDWNTANPGNGVFLNSANGSDIPDSGASIQLSGGSDIPSGNIEVWMYEVGIQQNFPSIGTDQEVYDGTQVYFKMGEIAVSSLTTGNVLSTASVTLNALDFSAVGGAGAKDLRGKRIAIALTAPYLSAGVQQLPASAALNIKTVDYYNGGAPDNNPERYAFRNQGFNKSTFNFSQFGGSAGYGSGSLQMAFTINVDASKVTIPQNAITTTHFTSEGIKTLDIGYKAITQSRLADSAITAAKLANDSVTAAKLSPNVAGDGIAQGAGGELDVNVGDAIKIASDAVAVDFTKSLINGNGSVLAVRDVVYIKSDGEVAWASKSIANLDDAELGIVATASNDNDPTDVVIRRGAIISGFSGLTPGQEYYVAASGGSIDTFANITYSAGDFVYKVGRALSATELIYDPEFKLEF